MDEHKKILNKDVSNVVEESLTGYLMAYRKYYKKIGEYNAFKYRGHRKDKVAMVIGGGSGMSLCLPDTAVQDLRTPLPAGISVPPPIPN